MAVKYDGSIRIDTKIDSKTADKGLSQLTSSLKGFASAVGLAFGIGAIVSFGKAAVQASSDLSNAMTGLQSIAEGSGRSFEQANAFIQGFISDGLVPATNAVTAYKNLLARGYDTQQIEEIMNRLKDAASFGRQASYSLGDAVTSATEGLKNENSILVDNAGVTKNVAKMWDEYAKSIGTTANKLTQAQKLQAEYVGIMNETRFQVGDAAKITQSYSGQVSMLAFGFNNLKVALGNAIIPVLQAILPYINAVITGLTRLANQLASFSGGIFGKAIVVDSANSATESVDGLTESIGESEDAAKKAGKAAQKALAPFDELLTRAEDSTKTTIGPVAGNTPELDLTATEWSIQDTLESAFDMSNYTLELDRVKLTWGGLKDRFAEIAGELAKQFENVDIKGEGFRTLLNLLYAIGEYANLLIGIVGSLMIAFDVPATVESGLVLLGIALQVIGDIIGVVSPIVKDFVENALAPVAQWVGGKVRDAFSFLGEQLTKIGDWFTSHAPLFERIGSGLTTIATAIWDMAEPLLDVAWTNIKDTITQLLDLLLHLGEQYLEIMSGLIDFIAGVFTGDWDRAWGGIWHSTKSFINLIIGGIEGMINRIINGFNWLFEKLNTLSIDLPEILGGGTIGFNLPSFSQVKLPRLAQGAVIPPNREFLAVLGDQKRGVNIETPGELMLDMFKKALTEMGFNGGAQDLNITVELDGEVVYRNQQRIATRHGKSIIPGVSG